MANYKITDLTELAEQPDNADWIPLVDTSDTSMAPTGTTKKLSAQRIVFEDLSGNSSLAGSVTCSALGAGTTIVATGVKIHATGNGNIVRLSTTTATQENYISFNQLNTQRALFGYEDVNNVAYISSLYGDIVFRWAATAGANTPTEYMRLKSGGNVGIGTASPTAKLDVAGTVKMDALRIDQTPTAGTFTATHYITVNLNGTNYRIPCAV